MNLKPILVAFALATLPLSGEIIQIAQSDFKEEILASKRPVVLEAYVPWCPACKKMLSIFSELSEEYGDRILFAKFDMDAEPLLAQELNVTAMPTFLFYRRGKLVDQRVGSMDRDALESEIKKISH